ncbi:MAG: RNA-directed DNA polymerase [Fusobacteriaceae bacterium]
MKRLNNVWEKIIDVNNIKIAHLMAQKGKAHYTAVAKVNKNLDFYCQEVSDMLRYGEYKLTTDDYQHETIFDNGKQRELYKLPYYPHRIIQWAIMNILENFFVEKFICTTYASIKGRGIHLAFENVKKDVKNNEWCLKLDIEKFYPNINNEILNKMIKNKLKDKKTLKLLKEIIFSRGDIGQPIGSLLSQYFGNYYLSKFDHFCKEELKLKSYHRYCDDIVVLNNSKEELHNLKEIFEKYLEKELRLKIKNNWQVFKIDDRGLDFVGYRFFSDKTIVRKRIYRKARVVFSRKQTTKSTASYYGWFTHSNNSIFLRKHKIIGGKKC